MNPENRRLRFENYFFDRNGKFVMTAYAVALIHFGYVIMFGYLEINFMCYYNIAVTALYLYLGLSAVNHGYFKFIYYTCVLEVPLHACLATLCLGLGWGFMPLILCLIPPIFYLAFSVNDLKHPIRLPSIVSVLIMLIYISSIVYGHHGSPLYPRFADIPLSRFVFYLNAFITCLSLSFFSFLFAYEVAYMRRQLIGENVKLEDMASFDPLTGLYNRRSIEEHLKKIMKENYYVDQSFSVIMCDLDDFKKVNDTYGHEAGDLVLRTAAQKMQSQVRDGDVIGRWGGEEFLIILNSNKAVSSQIAERIRDSIDNCVVKYKSRTIKISMTLGVAAYHSGIDAKSLVDAADKKLYRGKTNGKNQVVS